MTIVTADSAEGDGEVKPRCRLLMEPDMCCASLLECHGD